MKAKKLISLLLCFVMIVGILPMTVTAEETATVAETEEVKFNLFLDFNQMETATTANATSFTAAAGEETHFTFSHYNGTGGLSFVERDSNGDMALRTTNNHGLMIKDPQSLLAQYSFVFEYDVRFEKVAAGYNTVQFSFKNNAGTQVKTGLMPINANKLTGTDGKKYPATYHMSNNQNIGATTRPSGVAGDLIV